MLERLIPFKQYIIAGFILVYSLGLWHIASKYTSESFEKEKVVLTQKALDKINDRIELSKFIGASVEAAVGKIQITQRTINQEVIHEITKEPVYTNCVTTPDGVRLIESAIDNTGHPSSK